MPVDAGSMQLGEKASMPDPVKSLLQVEEDHTNMCRVVQGFRLGLYRAQKLIGSAILLLETALVVTN